MADKTALIKQLIETMNNTNYGVKDKKMFSGVNDIAEMMPTKSANKYDIFTYLPSVARAKGLEDTKNTLYSHARELTPDTATFNQVLADKDVYSGFKGNMIKALNNYSNQYLANYKKDPFYAFSKEGKMLAQNMQQLVNNPIIQKQIEFKKQEEKKYEDVIAKGLQDKHVIKDGKVLVKDATTGKPIYKNIDQVDYKTEKPLTYQDAHQLRVEGTANDLLEVNMNSYDDVWKKIKESASNLGKDEYKRLFGKKVVTQINQDKQLAMRKKWLIDQGLTTEDINALWSDFSTTHPTTYANNDAGFNQWLNDNINNYMLSSIDNTHLDASITNPANNANGDISKATDVGKIQEAFTSTPPISTISAKNNSNEQTVIKSTVPADVLTEWDNNTNVTVSIVKPVSSSIWTTAKVHGDNKTVMNLSEMPISNNPIITQLKDGPITTADGKKVESTTTMFPDINGKTFISQEINEKTNKRQFYMYIPVTVSSDEYNYGKPDWIEKSKTFGKYNPMTNQYTNDIATEIGNDDDLAKTYRNSINLYYGKDNGDYSWADNNAFKANENLFQGMIKVPIKEDYIRQARFLDENSLYEPKAFNASTRQANSAVQNNSNKGSTTYYEYKP